MISMYFELKSFSWDGLGKIFDSSNTHGSEITSYSLLKSHISIFQFQIPDIFIFILQCCERFRIVLENILMEIANSPFLIQHICAFNFTKFWRKNKKISHFKPNCNNIARCLPFVLKSVSFLFFHQTY